MQTLLKSVVKVASYTEAEGGEGVDPAPDGLSAGSGRRQGHPCRPPTPPDVPFGIRRFMKQTGSAAEFPAAKPAPYGRTRTWDRLGSCETRRHSTMGHAHWWLIATLA